MALASDAGMLGVYVAFRIQELFTNLLHFWCTFAPKVHQARKDGALLVHFGQGQGQAEAPETKGKGESDSGSTDPDGENNQEDEEEGDSTRDRCKNRWLPDELLSYLEKCDRKDTTEAVNRLVKRDKAGRFQLCLESNWWKETHQKFDAVKGKDKALGYTLTRAKAACGGQEGLDKALSTGEVRQVTENGTTFHVFKAGFVFFPFRSLLCFLLHAMQEIMGVQEFKDYVQGYALSLLPPTSALPNDPAGNSSGTAALALSDQVLAALNW
eukprot:s2522_g12.t1